MTAKAKVLIVDDESVVRQALTRILGGVYGPVGTAASGDEALQRMREERYDLVLLDLRMPGMDGLDVLKAIKRDWPECEVVIVTGCAGIELAKASVAAGAFDVLPKPVGPDDVIETTHDALMHKGFALRFEPALPMH